MFIYFVSPSHLLSSSYFSSSLPSVTQINHWVTYVGGTPPVPPSQLRCLPPSFIARRVQQFPPSSTRVGLCVHTLGAFQANFCTKKKTHYSSSKSDSPKRVRLILTLVSPAGRRSARRSNRDVLLSYIWYSIFTSWTAVRLNCSVSSASLVVRGTGILFRITTRIQDHTPTGTCP